MRGLDVDGEHGVEVIIDRWEERQVIYGCPPISDVLVAFQVETLMPSEERSLPRSCFRRAS